MNQMGKALGMDTVQRINWKLVRHTYKAHGGSKVYI